MIWTLGTQAFSGLSTIAVDEGHTIPNRRAHILQPPYFSVHPVPASNHDRLKAEQIKWEDYPLPVGLTSYFSFLFHNNHAIFDGLLRCNAIYLPLRSNYISPSRPNVWEATKALPLCLPRHFSKLQAYPL